MAVPENAVLTIAADAVGVVSAGLGGVLTIAPLTGRRWLGLTGTEVEAARVLGAADLALGVAIIAGRSSGWRWRAVAARAMLHLLFAREYALGDRQPHAFAMCALFVIDAGVAIGLRQHRRSA